MKKLFVITLSLGLATTSIAMEELGYLRELSPQERNSELVRAVQQGRGDEVKELLKLKADPNVKDSTGTPVLTFGVQINNGDIVDALLTSGANVESQDDFGDTPLYAAVEEGHADMVEKLLRFGADPNKKNKKGQTPLDIARSSTKPGADEIFRLLQSKTTKPLPKLPERKH